MVRVQPDSLPLAGRQRPGLLPDPDRDRNPTDVVHERRPPQRRQVADLDPAPLRRCAGQLAPLRPSDRPDTATRGRRIRPSRPTRCRSTRPPSIKCGDGSQASVCSHASAPSSSATISAAVSAKHAAIVGSNAPPARSRTIADREFDAAELTLSIGVARHMGDPHRQRNLVALHPARVALAVPALLKMREQRRDRSSQTEPLDQHLRHLAARGGRADLRPGAHGPRKRPRDRRGARPRWLPGRHRTQQRTGHLARRPEQNRQQVPRQHLRTSPRRPPPQHGRWWYSRCATAGTRNTSGPRSPDRRPGARPAASRTACFATRARDRSRDPSRSPRTARRSPPPPRSDPQPVTRRRSRRDSTPARRGRAVPGGP